MREAAIDTHRSTSRGAGRSRSAGAPPLDDMVGDGPVSRAAPRGGITSAAVAAQRLGGGRSGTARALRGRAGPGLLARVSGRLPRIRPVKALTIGAFGVALVGIVANAMVFQRGHHPSPLFGLGRSVDGAADGAAQRAASGTPPAVPAPAAPTPVERTGTIAPAPAAAEAPPPAGAATPKPAAPVHHAAKPHHDDAAKAKVAEAPASAAAHPRPGHPAPAHAGAAPKPEAKADAGPGTKGDPLGKLIAGAAHPAKPSDKANDKAAPAAHAAAKPETKAEHKAAVEPAHPDHAAKAAEAAPAHPHHRLAAAEAKPAPKASAAQPD